MDLRNAALPRRRAAALPLLILTFEINQK